MSEGLDELLNRAFTESQEREDREVQTDLLLEAGHYRTLPALTMILRESDRVKVTKDGVERPRVEIRYFAKVQEEISGKKGGIGFTLSPDKVVDESGRPDSASAKWVSAKKAFTVANGREPQTILEVAEYIRDYPVRLRITRLEGNERFPDPGNFVQSLSPVRD